MPTDDLPLPTLLSQLLLAFTIEFDNEFEHRAPHRTTSGGTGGRRRGPWLVSQLVRLTAKGRSAQDDYIRLLDGAEQRWRSRFGPGNVGALRRSLRSVIDQCDDGQPRLAQGLRPYPDGWRARSPYLRHTNALLSDPGGALPRYPMVLHRGGWPDGS